MFSASSFSHARSLAPGSYLQLKIETTLPILRQTCTLFDRIEALAPAGSWTKVKAISDRAQDGTWVIYLKLTCFKRVKSRNANTGGRSVSRVWLQPRLWPMAGCAFCPANFSFASRELSVFSGLLHRKGKQGNNTGTLAAMYIQCMYIYNSNY